MTNIKSPPTHTQSVPVDTPPPEAFVGGEYMDSTEEPEPSKPAVVETPTRVEEVTKPPPTRPPPTYFPSTIPVSTSPSTYKSPKAGTVTYLEGHLLHLICVGKCSNQQWLISQRLNCHFSAEAPVVKGYLSFLNVLHPLGELCIVCFPTKQNKHRNQSSISTYIPY